MMEMKLSDSKMTIKFGKIPFYYKPEGVDLDALVYNPSTIQEKKRLLLLASMSNGISGTFGRNMRVMIFNDIILNACDLLGNEFKDIGKQDEHEYIFRHKRSFFLSDISQDISNLCFQNKDKIDTTYYYEVLNKLEINGQKLDDELLPEELESLSNLCLEVQNKIKSLDV